MSVTDHRVLYHYHGWHHITVSHIAGLGDAHRRGAVLSRDILNLVYAAIDEVNVQAGDSPVIEKSLDAPLLDSQSGVDSLAFVNLIVAIEEQIQNRLHKSVVVVNEDTLVQEEHPFRTVGTLVAYVEKVVNK